MRSTELKTSLEQANFVNETIRLVLPDELNDVDFANGSGYIQLTLHTHAKFILRYRQLIEATMPAQINVFDRNPTGDWLGRMLDDTHNPAYLLWNRLRCVDSELRMWGQQYFAINPGNAKQVCLANI